MAMQRPIMNPTFVEEEGPRSTKKTFWDRLRPLLRLLKYVVRVLLWDPLAGKHPRGLRIEDGSRWQRFCRGLLYRLSFLPLFTALAVGALVYAATHPKQNSFEPDPNSQGIYYDAVTMRSDDGVRLEAWLVPAFDAEQINRDKELVLRQKQPAVLLVHDYGKDRSQMLPLVKPLHDAGFVVMVVALRGSGASQSSGSTFGLLEANDVKAAISALRKRDYVDTRRIAIVGVGIGANAALMTAQDDPGIRALVLDHPTQLGNQMLVTRIGPRNQWLKWMQPMCKWTFELFYQVDADELDLNRYTTVMNSRKTFMVDDHALPGDFRAAPAKNISRFLSANLLPEGVAAVELKK